VAMGNADETVKARADVVIGDNTTDSIAKFIYTHLL
ncbi:HAD hydrolase family protein, partial [Salmonella enterica]|nr:HAD hydrolase family protein [Salmonella enterica]